MQGECNAPPPPPPPGRSNNCRFCMVTVPFFKLTAAFVPRYSWDGGEVGIFSSCSKLGSALIPGTPCGPIWILHPCKVFPSLSLPPAFQAPPATCPPLPSTFGLWYAGITQMPSFRLLDPQGSLLHLSLYLVPASSLSPSAL